MLHSFRQAPRPLTAALIAACSLALVAKGSPALAQFNADEGLPAISIPVLPAVDTSSTLQPASSITNWSISDAPPDIIVLPNVSVDAAQQDFIDLPNVSQEDIDRFNEQSNLSRLAAPVVEPTVQNSGSAIRPFIIRSRSPLGSSQRSSSTAALTTRSNAASTTCAYYSSSNGLLGSNSAITVTEFSENLREDTVVSYQQFAPVSIGNRVAPVVVSKRTLVLYDTPLSTARRRLTSRNREYAELLGLPNSASLVRRGFGRVNRQLVCEEASF